MNQRKASVYFIPKSAKDSAKPPTLVEAEVLIRNNRIIQFYSVNNLIPREENDWHYWHVQSQNKKIMILKTYWERMLCYDENNNPIEMTPKI